MSGFMSLLVCLPIMVLLLPAVLMAAAPGEAR